MIYKNSPVHIHDLKLTFGRSSAKFNRVWLKVSLSCSCKVNLHDKHYLQQIQTLNNSMKTEIQTKVND